MSAAATKGDVVDIDLETGGKVIDSVPILHGDPFAPREGKTLTWRNVDMVLVSYKKGVYLFEVNLFDH